MAGRYIYDIAPPHTTYVHAHLVIRSLLVSVSNNDDDLNQLSVKNDQTKDGFKLICQ